MWERGGQAVRGHVPNWPRSPGDSGTSVPFTPRPRHGLNILLKTLEIRDRGVPGATAQDLARTVSPREGSIRETVPPAEPRLRQQSVRRLLNHPARRFRQRFQALSTIILFYREGSGGSKKESHSRRRAGLVPSGQNMGPEPRPQELRPDTRPLGVRAAPLPHTPHTWIVHHLPGTASAFSLSLSFPEFPIQASGLCPPSISLG